MEAVFHKNKVSLGHISELGVVNSQLSNRVSLIQEKGASKLAVANTDNAFAAEVKTEIMKHQFKQQLAKYHDLVTHLEALVVYKPKELELRISVRWAKSQDFTARQI